MLFRYRGSEGMLAWAFHRISGVAIWLFILLHVLDIWLAQANPALYDDVLQTYASPAGRVGATLLGAASMFAAYMIISQRLYPVPHAWTPLALATAGTVGVYVVTQRFEGGPLELLAEVLGLPTEAAILIGCRLIDPRSIAASLGSVLRARTR